MTARPKLSFDEFLKQSAELLRTRGSDTAEARLPSQRFPNEHRYEDEPPDETDEEPSIENDQHVEASAATDEPRGWTPFGRMSPEEIERLQESAPTIWRGLMLRYGRYLGVPNELLAEMPMREGRLRDIYPPGSRAGLPEVAGVDRAMADEPWRRQIVGTFGRTQGRSAFQDFLATMEVRSRERSPVPPIPTRRITVQVTGPDGIPRTETRLVAELGAPVQRDETRSILYGRELEPSRPPAPGEADQVRYQMSILPGTHPARWDWGRRLFEIVRHEIVKRIARGARRYMDPHGIPRRFTVALRPDIRPWRIDDEMEMPAMVRAVEFPAPSSGPPDQIFEHWSDNLDRLTAVELEERYGLNRDDILQLIEYIRGARPAWTSPTRSGPATPSQPESGRAWLLQMAERSHTDESPESSESDGETRSPPDRSPGASTGSGRRS